MAAFSLWPEHARLENCHLLLNEYGGLRFFFFSSFELSNNFLSVKYESGLIPSAE